MTQLNPNWIQALTYAARLDRQLVKATFTEGVLSGMKVVQRGAGANMSVDISVGTGVIYGDDQTDQGAYLVSCTVLENLAITAAPGSNSRRDLIYWRINDPNAGGPAGSNSAFGKVDGTPGASPALPALPSSAIPLAEVLVTAGNVTVTTAMITSLRVPSTHASAPIPGVAVPFFGPEASIPADAVVCYGQQISRDTFWRIFYYIGTTYGVGDGSTTFNTPDLRGRSLFGLDNMGGSDAARLGLANTLGLAAGAADAIVPLHDHASFNIALKDVLAESTLNLNKTTIGAYEVTHVMAWGDSNQTARNLAIDVPSMGSSLTDANLPPLLLCNWIMRN